VTVGLSKAIAGLRDQLEQAMDEGRGHRLLFDLSSVEVALEISWELQADGKFGWSVLGLGAEAAAHRTTTQTLRLTLDPVEVAADGTTRRGRVSDTSDGTQLGRVQGDG
jgi:long-subunit fatty acid transport protein